MTSVKLLTTLSEDLSEIGNDVNVEVCNSYPVLRISLPIHDSPHPCGSVATSHACLDGEAGMTSGTTP
jgi:hypothetical protein